MLLAISAYGFWGVSPIYFKWLAHVDALEILSHRVVWSLAALLLGIGFLGYRRRLYALLCDLRLCLLLSLTAALLVCNWLLFVHAAQTNRIAEASLGYFINPLFTIMLGMVFLQERLRALQWLALLFGAVAVLNDLLRIGSPPWIALGLATTFSIYSLIRKRIGVGGFHGLLIEVGWLAPLALIWILFGVLRGQSAFLQGDLAVDGALALAGLVTTFPLVCFGSAALRLPLSSLGFYQYLAPSISLVLAVAVYFEPFDLARWLTFSLIFVALAFFTLDEVRELRRHRSAVARV